MSRIAGAGVRPDTMLPPGSDLAGPVPGWGARVLAWTAGAGISSSILIMIWASLLRSSWQTPALVMPSVGPPWELQSVHVSVRVVTVALWLATILGAGGVAAGVAAVRGGVRVSARAVLGTGLLVVAVLTVLPPVGSTDVLNYATYGRIVVIGHSPYVMTPYQLRMLHDAYSGSVPVEWQNHVTLYGPLATFEEFVSALLGGTSAARIVFWLKMWNAIAFGAVAVAAHRVLRSDPAARLRAHLLWTINPLLLWSAIAAGHVDVLGAAVGVFGLLVVGARPALGTSTARGAGPVEAAGRAETAGRLSLARRPAVRPGPLRAVLAGVLIGIAADIKIFYVLLGFGLAWVLRRSLRDLTVAVGGALAVLVPTYAWFGPPAITALLDRRNKATADNFYQLLSGPNGYVTSHVALVASVIVGCLAVLTLWRLPARVPAPPAIQPALALSVAWLFVWPYQLPWYDVMIVCLLVLYPASRLDWLVLARLTAGTIAIMPGNPWLPPGHLLTALARISLYKVVPAVLLASALGLVALCLSGRWKLRPSAVGPHGGRGSRAPVAPGTAAVR